jgi:hypothetical protein
VKDEEVMFISKDLLVDCDSLPPLSSTVEQDLKLAARDMKKLVEKLDQAVTMDRFGQLISLDADSESAVKSAKQRVAAQNEKYVAANDAKKAGFGAELNMRDAPPWAQTGTGIKIRRPGRARGSPMRTGW